MQVDQTVRRQNMPDPSGGDFVYFQDRGHFRSFGVKRRAGRIASADLNSPKVWLT